MQKQVTMVEKLKKWLKNIFTKSLNKDKNKRYALIIFDKDSRKYVEFYDNFIEKLLNKHSNRENSKNTESYILDQNNNSFIEI